MLTISKMPSNINDVASVNVLELKENNVLRRPSSTPSTSSKNSAQRRGLDPVVNWPYQQVRSWI